MIVGRLGKSLIQELDQKHIPQFLDMQRKRGIPIPDRAIVNRYFHRDRAQDDAYFTTYAYADISGNRKYNRLLPRDSSLEPIRIDCTIDHIIYEGLLPISSIDHGHKHILFMRFAEGPPSCIQTYDTIDELVKADWKYAFSDSECCSSSGRE